MTVSYSFDVSRNSWAAVFKVIFRWRGSVWKSIWKELLAWLFLYYVVMFVYRSKLILSENGEKIFELVREHILRRLDAIPLNFLLGFFVTMIVDRWRKIFMNMGFIENIAHSIAAFCRQREPDDVLSRRAMIRYICLAQVLVFRDISLKVRRRFPNLDAVVKAGFMEEHERKIYEAVQCDYHRFWIPINWACTIAMRQRDANRITGDNPFNSLIGEIKQFRSSLQLLSNFDWVPVPLAYPQLVFCAVRTYFLLCTVARQHIIGPDAFNRSLLDIAFPLMTMLQFICYVGWMKVAECLLNPMGEDDDHFECNYLIDRNIQTGLAIVDDTFDTVPALYMDRFKVQPKPMYTEETAPKEQETFTGSVAHLILRKEHEKVNMIAVDSAKKQDSINEAEFSSGVRRRSLQNRLKSIIKKRMNSEESVKSDFANVYHTGELTPPLRINSKKKKSNAYEDSFDNYSIDTTDFPNPFFSSQRFERQSSEKSDKAQAPIGGRRGSLFLEVVSEETNSGSSNIGSPNLHNTSLSESKSDTEVDEKQGALKEEFRNNSSMIKTKNSIMSNLMLPETPVDSRATSPSPRGFLKKRRLSTDYSGDTMKRVSRSEPASRDPAVIQKYDPSTQGALHDLLRKKLLQLEMDDKSLDGSETKHNTEEKNG